MKKIKLFTALLGIILLVSCEDPESIIIPQLPNNPPVQEVASRCKLLKYNKLIFDDNVFYLTELQFEGNLITKRLNYTTALYLLSTDNIVYNSNNLVDKIHYGLRGSAIELYDKFFYTPNNPNPFKRERIRTMPNGYTEKWIENITYQNNKIIKTVGFYEDLPQFQDVKTYTYNSEGNLTQTINTSHPNHTASYITVETTTYSKYDALINPFKNINVPFIENRSLKYSTNNCRKIEYTKTENGVLTSNSQWEITEFGSNEFGYPLLGEYLCN